MKAFATLDVEETNQAVTQWVTDATKCEVLRRRLHARHPFRYPATLSRGGFEIIGMCRDISKLGIGLLQHECPPVEGPLNVIIWIDGKMIELDADICRVQDLGKGWWASGGKLIRSSIGFSTLLSSRIRGMIDRRVHKRYPYCVAMDLLIENPDPAQGPLESDDAFVLSQDISLGGMCILSSLPANIGDIVFLRPTNSKAPGCFIRSRIVTCSALENSYYSIGVQFEPAAEFDVKVPSQS